MDVAVEEDKLSQAIGRGGQNIKLASQLTGWSIDIITETEESERRQKEFAERTELFMEALDVDEVIAQLLATEGFANVEDVAYSETDELAVMFDTFRPLEVARSLLPVEDFDYHKSWL